MVLFCCSITAAVDKSPGNKGAAFKKKRVQVLIPTDADGGSEYWSNAAGVKRPTYHDAESWEQAKAEALQAKAAAQRRFGLNKKSQRQTLKRKKGK